MKTNDFDYIARTIAHLSGIPTRVFEGDALCSYHSVVCLPKDPLEVFRKEIFSIKDHVGYYITPRFQVYGIVNAGHFRIIVGPSAQIFAGDQEIRELAFQADVAKEDVQAFVDGIRRIVHMPLESMLMMLCSINFTVNGEKLELKDITIDSDQQERMKSHIEQNLTKKRYDEEPAVGLHNTLLLEESLLSIVRKGDSAALRRWLSAMPAVRAGLMAPNQLRQLKNTFIVTATLVSRAAIQGGLDSEVALTLSDAYIQQTELLNSQTAITNLQYNMVLEFTEQVEKVRWGNDPTTLAVSVANYIQRHLSETIRTEDIAKEFFLSRTHFTSKFRQETGMTLKDFIQMQKTEEAKRLLRYSDKQLAAIASYLGFSSQGHFTNVFRKYAGMTPNEYRGKNDSVFSKAEENTAG